jgi:hypothetical protein
MSGAPPTGLPPSPALASADRPVSRGGRRPTPARGSRTRRVLTRAYLVGVHLFAILGLMFAGAFVGIRLQATNVSGRVDTLSEAFQRQTTSVEMSTPRPSAPARIRGVGSGKAPAPSPRPSAAARRLCVLDELSRTAPSNVRNILDATRKVKSPLVESQMIFAVETHLEDRAAYEQHVAECAQAFARRGLTETAIEDRVQGASARNVFGWPDTEEWQVVAASINKDKEAIDRAAAMANIGARLIVSNLMVEQLRMSSTARGLSKKYFASLKILANSLRVSLGVMAIKEDTAVEIERHLKDQTSPYYLAPEYEHVLDYPPGQDPGRARYSRLTDDEDHYYSYLYGALYLRQVIRQWGHAGYDIASRPEILATLFNVGFSRSNPNPSPKVGGAAMDIGGTDYTFGRLAHEFYYSGELADEFPYVSSR